jgi:hypothetical protein
MGVSKDAPGLVDVRHPRDGGRLFADRRQPARDAAAVVTGYRSTSDRTINPASPSNHTGPIVTPRPRGSHGAFGRKSPEGLTKHADARGNWVLRRSQRQSGLAVQVP